MHVPQAASQTVVRHEASTALSSAGAEAATPSPALASARAIARLRYVVVVALLVPTFLFAAVAWYLHQQAFNDARHQLDAVVSNTLAETIEMALKHPARSDGQGASVDP